MLYGERLRDVYPHATTWQVIKYKVSLLIHKLLKGIALVAIISIAILLAQHYSTETYVRPTDNSSIMFSQKIDGLKDEVVAKILSCESAGYTEDDGILIFDSNKKASIGQAQFQVSTVQHYYKVLYNRDITKKEAVLIALDTDKASKLAKDIIFLGDNRPSKDWVICSRKHGLDAQVELIKKLEK